MNYHKTYKLTKSFPALSTTMELGHKLDTVCETILIFANS